MGTDIDEKLARKLDQYRNDYRRESGERLRQERVRLGLSQADLSKKLGIHRNTQSKYEAGERDPDISYYKKLDELGISVAYVVDGSRFEHLPGEAGIIVRGIFEEASQLGLLQVNSEAIARLVYLLASSKMCDSYSPDDAIDGELRKNLIMAAFQRGSEFYEAAVAISKYGYRISGDRPVPRDEAALILETLQLFDANKDHLHLSLTDNIRLIADDLVEHQSSLRK